MILVVGATGSLGGTITRALLERGEDVRVLVRPGSDYQPLVESGARPIQGDLKESATLGPACDGIDVVITTANTATRGGEDTVQSVDLAGNRQLIDAAKAAGVKQFVFTSAFGSALDSPAPFMQAKASTEHYLRNSGLDFTILAPTIFLDVWVPMVVGQPLMQNQPVTLIGEGRRKHAFIAARDVVAFAVASVGHPAAINQYLPLGGPEAVSWRDIIATVEQVTGRAVAVCSIPVGEPVPGMADFITGVLTSMEFYDNPLDTSELARTFGVEQTTPAAFVQGFFGGADGSGRPGRAG